MGVPGGGQGGVLPDLQVQEGAVVGVQHSHHGTYTLHLPVSTLGFSGEYAADEKSILNRNVEIMSRIKI